jgi:hypothetical protein
MIKTLKEFILNTTQLANTGKEYSIKLFYTNNKKTVSGKLVGVHNVDSDVIEYTIKKNNRVVHGMTMYIQDIESEAQVRYSLKAYLLQSGWETIGTRDNKI